MFREIYALMWMSQISNYNAIEYLWLIVDVLNLGKLIKQYPQWACIILIVKMFFLKSSGPESGLKKKFF